MTTQRLEPPDLLTALHTFCDHRKTQRVAESDDRPDDCSVVVPSVQVGDEAAIDLETLDGEPLQVTERGVPGAEVVYLDMEAQLSNPLQDRNGFTRLTHKSALGDLQPHIVRIDTGIL